MTYRFQSKASGDVIMLEPDGDKVLAAMGLEPAARGILRCANIAAAIDALEAAIAQDEAGQARAPSPAHAVEPDSDEEEVITLRQRAWPLVELMRRAHAEGVDVVWGV
jgi:hypothetical protein